MMGLKSGTIYFIYIVRYADSESEVRFLIGQKLSEIKAIEDGIIK